MKKLGLLLLLVILFLCGVLGSIFFWWSNATKAPSNQNTSKRVVIKKGSSVEIIAQELQNQGVIKSALAFKIYTQVRDLTSNIQAGEFNLPTNVSLPEVIALLQSGPKELWVTVPEGLRREQIAERFTDTFQMEESQAIAFKKEFLVLSQELEGYLFPDTYLFAKSASASAIVSKMRDTFSQKTKGLAVTKDAVIMASILERETKKPEEAPIVAGVFKNRLEIGMPLQADATAQYAWGSINCEQLEFDCDWWRTPTRADLQIDSPFNTYKVNGLPPFPIASPGFVMIQSALNPVASDYLYYIHDSKGQIHYARTLEEHNQNIAKYLN